MNSRMEDQGALKRTGLGSDGILQLYGFALIASCAALLASAMLLLLRAGLGDNLGHVLEAILFCLLPPWTCAWAASMWPKRGNQAACAGTAGFLVGALFPVAGLVFGKGAVPIAAILLLVSAWNGRSALGALVGNEKFWLGLPVLALAVLFVLFTSPVRIYLPEAMLTGTPNPDAYYQAALSQMVLHYGTFSVGADGLIWHHYHFLSHFVAAGMANASLLSVPQVYSYWGAIGLKVDVLAAFFFSSTLLLRRGGKTAAQLVGGLLFSWFAASFTCGFESESHVLGLAILIAALPLLLVMTGEPAVHRNETMALVAIAAMVLCAAAKISAGFYGGIALALAAWNYRGRTPDFMLLVFGITLLAVLTYLLILNRDMSLNTPLTMLATSYLSYINWGTFYDYAVIIITLLALTLRPAIRYLPIPDGAEFQFKKSSSEGGAHRSLSFAFRHMLATDRLTQFMVFCLLGCLAVLITQPIGNNMTYFSLPLTGLALLMLPVTLGENSNISLSSPMLRLVLGSLVILFGSSRVEGFLSTTHLTLLNIQNGVLDRPAFRPLNASVQASLSAHKPPLYILGQQLAASPQAKFVSELERLNRDAGGKLTVQVAPEATDIWKWSKIDGFWCTSGHLIVPAETGIVEVRSVAPASIERQCVLPGLAWYGYGNTQDQHRTALFNDSTLCELARPMGARKVYRLVSYKDLSRNALVTCG